MPSTLLSTNNEADLSSTCDKYTLTRPEFSSLEAAAKKAKQTAYCPYSRFRVGAVVLASDGDLISGANVENASYPVGTCAERVALGKAVTEDKFALPSPAEGGEGKEGNGTWQHGGRGGKRGFRALAVATDVSPPASPCGMCRQFIREFCEIDMPIIMFDKEHNFVVMTLEELLPLSFGPNDLPQTQT